MFDSYDALSSWAMPYLQEAAGSHRGIIEIRGIQVSIDMDPGDGSDHGSIDHVCQSYCAYPRSGIMISGIGIRASGSEVRLHHEIDADSFSFVDFLDEIQRTAAE